jgi:hypothetical protein
MVLRLDPAKPLYRDGESFAFRISASMPGYVYCYGKDADFPLQRVFPNRYTPDPRIEPGKSLELPGGRRFGFTASDQLRIACLAVPREVYNDVPPALRWGDFQALNAVRGMDDVRRILEAVAKEPIAMVELTVPLAAAAAPAASHR